MTASDLMHGVVRDTRSTPLPFARPPAHLSGVDGLRGIAALIVVIYHLFTNSGHPEIRIHGLNVLRPLHDGWSGVNLFLVLSGFCLYWPIARAPERRQSYSQFITRRVRRIVPAYYFSLLFVPLAYWLIRCGGMPVERLPLPKNAWDVILHLPLLHFLSPTAFRSWNGVTWSLALEWSWYLAFPAAVWLFRRWGALRAVAVMVAITLLYRFGLYWTLGPSGDFAADRLDYTFTLRSFLAARLAEFGLGMGVAWWLANRRITKVWVLLAMAAVPLLLAMAHGATPLDPFLPARDILYGLAFSSLLLVVVSAHGRGLKAICEHVLLQHIGQCSYSLYLLHLPFVSLVTGLLKRSSLSSLSIFGLSLLSIPLMIVCAQVAYLLVEKPFLSSARRIDAVKDSDSMNRASGQLRIAGGGSTAPPPSENAVAASAIV